MKTFTLPKLTSGIVTVLEDLKFTDILVCDTKKKSVLFDKVVIATCNTARQAHAAIREMHKAHLPIQNVEGQRAEEWILADCGAIVVHMMLPKIREYFRLEELWQSDESEKPIRKTTKASPAEPKKIKAVVQKKSPAKKPATKATSSPRKTTRTKKL